MKARFAKPDNNRLPVTLQVSLHCTCIGTHCQKRCFHRTYGSFSNSIVIWHFFSTSAFSTLHHTHKPYPDCITLPSLSLLTLTSIRKFLILPRYCYNIWHYYNLFLADMKQKLAMSKAETAKTLHLRNKFEIPRVWFSKVLIFFMAPHTCRAQIQAIILAAGNAQHLCKSGLTYILTKYPHN